MKIKFKNIKFLLLLVGIALPALGVVTQGAPKAAAGDAQSVSARTTKPEPRTTTFSSKKPRGKKYTCDIFYVATVTGVIDPATQRYVSRLIGRAEREDRACFIMEIDTPGGLMDSMKEIATKMINASVPTVVYVYPSGSTATSAGFFILMASDIAAMAPSTSTGSAHPVQMQGGQMDKTMKEKVTNYATAYMDTLSKRQGRNMKLARRAVTRSISITEDEAIKEGVVEVIASGPDDLAKKLDGRKFNKNGKLYKLRVKKPEFRRVGMNRRERFLHIVGHPNIAYIFFMIGVYGLIFEITHPGAIFPGLIGAVALILAFVSFSVLPINIAGLILLAGAFVMFALELKIVSHGLLTLGGVILMILGSLMLVDSSDPAFRISLGVIITAATCTSLLFGVALAAIVKTHKTRVTTGEQGMVGKVGKAKTPLAPAGKILVHGEIWDARSEDGSEIAEGEKVEVARKEGMELVVRKKQGVG